MIELKQMRIFLAVAEELHFGRAAERLHIAQPALSAQVKAMEERLGANLFERTTRRVSLTRTGEAFLPEARATIAQAEEAFRIARRTAGEGDELLKIGGIDSATAGLLPSLIRSFRRHSPGTEVRVEEMLSAPALHALEHRQLDVAFCRLPRRAELFQSRHVLREELVAILPHDHRLAERDKLSPMELCEEPLVLPSRAHRPILTTLIEEWFTRSAREPRVRQFANERHMIVAMVAAGLGVSITPAWVSEFGRSDVVFRQLEGAPVVDTHAHWRRDDGFGALAAFTERLPTVQLG